MNDSAVFGVSAAGSLGAGVVMQLFGWNAALGMSILAIALLARVRSGTEASSNP